MEQTRQVRSATRVQPQTQPVVAQGKPMRKPALNVPTQPVMQTQPVTQVLPVQEKKSRWWIWLIVALVAIGIGVGAYFLIKYLLG